LEKRVGYGENSSDDDEEAPVKGNTGIYSMQKKKIPTQC
jgi:hypothetical protein